MEIFTLFVTAVLLAWASLAYVQLRRTRRGGLWLLPKVAAATFSFETALVGVPSVVVGTVSGSPPRHPSGRA